MLNLPGELYYSLIINWMYKFRGGGQELADNLTTYVDDYKVVDGS